MPNALPRTAHTPDYWQQEADATNAAAREFRNVARTGTPQDRIDAMEYQRLLRRASDMGWLLVDCDGVLTLREFSTSAMLVAQGGKPWTRESVGEFLAALERRQGKAEEVATC